MLENELARIEDEYVAAGYDREAAAAYRALMGAHAAAFERLYGVDAASTLRAVNIERADAGESAGNAVAPGERNQSPVDPDAFRKWFGDSKVVDAQGEPLELVHFGDFDEAENIPEGAMHFGTEDAARQRMFGKVADDYIEEIEVYEEDGVWHWEAGGMSSYEYGEEFDDEASAREAAENAIDEIVENEQEEPEGNFTCVYLNIRNPKRMTDQGSDWDAAIKTAKQEGYDGIVYRNMFEDKGSDSWIAFSPTQIKSVNNYGAFDPNDPRILYQYAGENSRMSASVRANLAEAVALAESGTDNEAIRQKTGWFQGMDGRWRYEIPDFPDRIDLRLLELAGEDGVLLPQLYDNKKLFMAYPRLQNLVVKTQDMKNIFAGGKYSPGNGGTIGNITINSEIIATNGRGKPSAKSRDIDREKKSILLHEIQHAIQNIEGFAQGVSLGSYSTSLAPKIDKLYRKILGELPPYSVVRDSLRDFNIDYIKQQMEQFSTDPVDLRTAMVENRKDAIAFDLDLDVRLKHITPGNAREYSRLIDEFLSAFINTPFVTPADQYEKTAGEIEANDAADRSRLKKTERAAQSPDLRSDAIVLFGREQVAAMSLKPATPRGSVTFGHDGQSLTRIFASADLSTPIHEGAHVFINDLTRVVEDNGLRARLAYEREIAAIPADIDDRERENRRKVIEARYRRHMRGLERAKADMRALRENADEQREAHGKAVGRAFEEVPPEGPLTPGQYRTLQEVNAAAFEHYLLTDNAPPPKVEGIFSRMKAWLAGVYEAAKTVAGVCVTPEAREVFERLLSAPDEDEDEESAAGQAP